MCSVVYVCGQTDSANHVENFVISNEFATFAMKTTELKRLLREHGCYETRTNARGHDVWFSPITKAMFRVPRHASQEVAKGTLNQILKQAGIKGK